MPPSDDGSVGAAGASPRGGALPLYQWPGKRRSGILLHPTALPGGYGIGTLGEEAFRWIDFLADHSFQIWQMCPLGPTGYGDSPYQALSSFAGNPYLLDPDELVAAELLTPSEVERARRPDGERVDYGRLWNERGELLARAARRGLRSPPRACGERYGSWEEFREAEADWLEPYAWFLALKEARGQESWTRWPEEWRSWDRAREAGLPREHRPRAEEHAFLQYLFAGQWARVREHARARGLLLVGDIPIFVALDSADVWRHPEYFQLGPDLQPTVVAGVPPDYFSATGQLWGNPLYDWDRLAADDYGWWMDRIRRTFALFDWVRVDHFRGFAASYAVPAGERDARRGSWQPGPGIAFFERLHREFPEPRLILEDLGLITPEVEELRERTGLPGMAILQFAFSGPDNAYLPHHLRERTVVYPGTHDNDTTRGWYEAEDEGVRDFARRYLRVSGETIAWDFIRAAYASVASVAVIALQDFLHLGSEARFNTPSVAEGNWSWRASRAQLDGLARESGDYLRELAYLYDREP